MLYKKGKDENMYWVNLCMGIGLFECEGFLEESKIMLVMHIKTL